MKVPERSARLAEAFRGRILVLDGAMGTMIQAAQPRRGRTSAGPSTRAATSTSSSRAPTSSAASTTAYLDAGADIVETNTFGGTPYVLAEYGLAERCHEITLAAARLAREAAERRSTRRSAALRRRAPWARRAPSPSPAA